MKEVDKTEMPELPEGVEAVDAFDSEKLVSHMIEGKYPGQMIICTKAGHNYEGLGFGIHFQEGPSREAGVNGLADADLINIEIDRLEYFETEHLGGKYSCEENILAIHYLKKAKNMLDRRDEKRKARGVFGTSAV